MDIFIQYVVNQSKHYLLDSWIPYSANFKWYLEVRVDSHYLRTMVLSLICCMPISCCIVVVVAFVQRIVTVVS